MLIIQKKLGMQFANRLFLFSHFIANAIENKYTLINPTFDEYCHYFYATKNNDFGEYPIYTKFKVNPPFILFKTLTGVIAKVLPTSKWHEVVKTSGINYFDLDNPVFLNKVNQKIVIADGWIFRDHKGFEKHANIIRKYFTPDDKVVNRIDELMLECRSQAEIIIGVHLRRGDYRLWEGGKYYFNDDIYIDKIQQLKNHFNSIGKKVIFLICSNEPIQDLSFSKYNIKLGTNNLIEDLYSLARCNYLIGPPSTFSMWASFYGKVPLLHIETSSQSIKPEDFLIVKS
jgi:hypothetical protein